MSMIPTGTPAQELTENVIAPLQLTIATDAHTVTLLANPEPLFDIVHAGIKRQLTYEVNPDAPQDIRLKALLMRSTVKGALLAAGGLVLDMIYGSKDHPKPGKKDDLIEWYACEFAKFALVMATRGVLVMQAEPGENFEQERAILIHEIRPVPYASPVGPDSRNETERAGTRGAPTAPATDARGYTTAPI